MGKDMLVYGVDISKNVFDVFNTITGFNQFENNDHGFKEFLEIIPENAIVIMEATGYYHYSLAQYLDSKNVTVSVVNPLSVKRFIQMRLSKIKTDKSDAKAICEFGKVNNIPKYNSLSKIQSECYQLLRLLDGYLKQRTAIKNKIKGETILGEPADLAQNSLFRSLKHLEIEIGILEERLLELVKEEYGYQLELLIGIPGIGLKTAMSLILLTDGLNKFDKAGQLCSYVGITPIIRQSGTSIRGKSRISKIGNKKLRNLLFLCAFSACKYNRACRELYERIIAKGKSKKLALIAVSNKLLKQAFAIVKTGLPYDEHFVSSLNR